MTSTPRVALAEAKSAPKKRGVEENPMKYAYQEVISDSEAKRFARNLCKKREKFPSFDDALEFVFKIRKVVSDAEFVRMNREHCRRLAWQMQRDEQPKTEPPTPREVEAEVSK